MRELKIVSAKIGVGGEQYIYDLSDEMKDIWKSGYALVRRLKKFRGFTDIVNLRKNRCDHMPKWKWYSSMHSIA